MKNAIWTCCIVFASLFYAGCEETVPVVPLPPDPEPPRKTTPTAITDTAIVYPNVGVVLSGRVNPNGLPTKYFFEYGSTAVYGSTTEVKDAGSDTALVSVADTVAAVAVEPIRHFRMIAFTSEDTSAGGDVSLDLQHAPIVVIPSFANGGPNPLVRNTYVVVYGHVLTRELETRCYFEYGVTAAYGRSSVPIVLRSQVDTCRIGGILEDLAPGQIYHLRLVAQNSAGIAQSEDLLFTSPIPTQVIVEPPTNITSASAVFNAKIFTGGRSASCWVDYGLSDSYGLKSTTQPISAGETWTIVSIRVDKLTRGTIYHWQFSCTFDGGLSFRSGDSVLTTSMVASDPREFVFPDLPGTKLHYEYAYEFRTGVYPGGFEVRGTHTWTIGLTTRVGTTATIQVTEDRIDTVHSWYPGTDTTYVSIETLPFLVTVAADSIAVPFPTQFLGSKYKSLPRYLEGTDTFRIQLHGYPESGYCTYQSGIGLSSYSITSSSNSYYKENMSIINIVR